MLSTRVFTFLSSNVTLSALSAIKVLVRHLRRNTIYVWHAEPKDNGNILVLQVNLSLTTVSMFALLLSYFKACIIEMMMKTCNMSSSSFSTGEKKGGRQNWFPKNIRFCGCLMLNIPTKRNVDKLMIKLGMKSTFSELSKPLFVVATKKADELFGSKTTKMFFSSRFHVSIKGFWGSKNLLQCRGFCRVLKPELVPLFVKTRDKKNIHNFS